MNKKKIIISAIVILIAAVSLILWKEGSKSGEVGKSSLEKAVVSLKWLHQAQFAGLYVAKEKGFYADAGLDVKITEWDFTVSQEDELAQGVSDFAVLNPVELLEAIGKGLDFRAVAVIYRDAAYALIASKDSGIETPADFRGKILSNKGGTDDGKIVFPALLKAFDVGEDEVTYVDSSFDTHEADDIASGSADVSDLYRTDQVYVFQQRGMEYNLILPEKFGFEMYGDVLVTTQKLIDENPDFVKRFVQATIAGWEYAVTNPSEAVDLTMPYVTNEIYKDRDLEVFILGNSIPLIKPEGVERIGGMEFVRWQRLYESMQSVGLLENDFDVTQVFTRKFLR